MSTGRCLLRPLSSVLRWHLPALSAQGPPSLGVCFLISRGVRAPPQCPILLNYLFSDLGPSRAYSEVLELGLQHVDGVGGAQFSSKQREFRLEREPSHHEGREALPGGCWPPAAVGCGPALGRGRNCMNQGSGKRLSWSGDWASRKERITGRVGRRGGRSRWKEEHGGWLRWGSEDRLRGFDETSLEGWSVWWARRREGWRGS